MSRPRNEGTPLGFGLTQERLKELLSYNKETGQFHWAMSRGNKVKKGELAGSAKSGRGYFIIWIDYRAHLAHRLAWLYVTGQHPKNQIDHINGDKLDNAFANLRDVSQAINNQNRRRANATSRTNTLGVFMRGEYFSARIRVGKRLIYKGVFKTSEEAHAAYVKAKRELHEGCTL